MASSPSPLAAIASLAGGAMAPDSLLSTAATLEQLGEVTGYKSLATFAKACREMHEEMRNEIQEN